MTIDFEKLSDDALEKLISKAYQERDRRANARKEKLIDAFRKAYDALIEAKYDVFVNDTCIANFDEFDFY